jgi:hypothetical protein
MRRVEAAPVAWLLVRKCRATPGGSWRLTRAEITKISLGPDFVYDHEGWNIEIGIIAAAMRTRIYLFHRIQGQMSNGSRDSGPQLVTKPSICKAGSIRATRTPVGDEPRSMSARAAIVG